MLAQNGNAEQEVRATLNQMIDADLKEDAVTLAPMLTDDFTIIRDNGMVRNKAEVLQGVQEGSTKFEKFQISDVHVRIYGETAVVTFHEDLKGLRAGQAMSGEFREVRVFVKSGGKWRAVLGQRTRIVP